MSSHSPATSVRADSPLTMLIWASAMGTYLLLAIGGITSVLDGGRACSGWPTCGPLTVAELSEPALLVAVGHRIAALCVGVLLVMTLAYAWPQRSSRVRASILLAVVLYPFQVGLGALAATREAARFSIVHLSLGVGIFALTILALLWHLERNRGTAQAKSESPSEPISTDIPPPAVIRPSEPASTMEPTAGVSETDATIGVSETNATIGVSETDATTEISDMDANGGVSDMDANGGVSDTDATTGTLGPQERLLAYFQLTKPRLQWLLCLVAVAAMALAAGPELSVTTASVTVLGGMLAVGSSGTFNNVLERDADQEMDRTADRPLVEGRIPVHRAVAFGVVLAVLSFGLFVIFVNVLSAVLALLAILFYSIVYTLLLKPNTMQNTVLGGVVGAFPALIGWAAVENTIGVPALVLGAVIFLWTPAHFYNLALAYRDDYARAGFPMLPVVRGTATTHRHILLYLGATLTGSVMLGVLTRLDWLYAITIVLVGGVFLWAALRLFQERSEQAAFRTFHASNAYLGFLLVAILIDTLVV